MREGPRIGSDTILKLNKVSAELARLAEGETSIHANLLALLCAGFVAGSVKPDQQIYFLGQFQVCIMYFIDQERLARDSETRQ